MDHGLFVDPSRRLQSFKHLLQVARLADLPITGDFEASRRVLDLRLDERLENVSATSLVCSRRGRGVYQSTPLPREKHRSSNPPKNAQDSHPLT
jgi:hypothetical protein